MLKEVSHENLGFLPSLRSFHWANHKAAVKKDSLKQKNLKDPYKRGETAIYFLTRVE